MPTTTRPPTDRDRRRAAAIQAARRKAGFTQEAAAKLFGVSVWTIRNWEHAMRSPPESVRARIVEEWGGDPEALEPGRERCPVCKQLLPEDQEKRP
jgi:transcriptional regulator with XRE-family HTH domain